MSEQQQSFAGMPVAVSRVRITIELPAVDADGQPITLGHGDLVSGTFTAAIAGQSSDEKQDREGNPVGSISNVWKASGVEALCEITHQMTRAERDQAWRNAVRTEDVA